MKSFLTLVLTSLVALQVYAQESSSPMTTDVIIHIASKHQSLPGQSFTEVNPGGAVRINLTDAWSIQGGTYKNSYAKQTVYTVGQYQPLQIGSVKVGGFVGLASGYKQPIVAGTMATTQFGIFTSTIRFTPKYKKDTAGVVTIEVGVRF